MFILYCSLHFAVTIMYCSCIYNEVLSCIFKKNTKKTEKINSCYYGEINVKCYKEKSYHYQIYHCLKTKPSFHKKLFQKEKKNYCYGFMPSNFQIICSSMVSENRLSPASIETPVFGNTISINYSRHCLET